MGFGAFTASGVPGGGEELEEEEAEIMSRGFSWVSPGFGSRWCRDQCWPVLKKREKHQGTTTLTTGCHQQGVQRGWKGRSRYSPCN